MTHDPNMPHLDAGIMQCDCDTQAELYSVHLYCTVYNYTITVYTCTVQRTPVLYRLHLYCTGIMQCDCDTQTVHKQFYEAILVFGSRFRLVSECNLKVLD